MVVTLIKELRILEYRFAVGGFFGIPVFSNQVRPFWVAGPATGGMAVKGGCRRVQWGKVVRFCVSKCLIVFHLVRCQGVSGWREAQGDALLWVAGWLGGAS